MTCFHPIAAVQGEDGLVRFHESRRLPGFRDLQLSCGQCIGCRLERSRQWAVRCMHEAQMHERSCFITLTYREGEVPPFGSLRYRDFQLFMKRLRKEAGSAIRFFMCGEYGGLHARPHFHACVFGFDFPDKLLFKRGVGGALLYRSPVLERLWPVGFSTIGDVTFQSAAYVARYVMKKVTGDAGLEHYSHVDKETGEVSQRCPEFCRMSLKPGIGRRWLDKFWSDVYPSGKVVVNGVESNAPRYYDKVHFGVDPVGAEDVAFERELLARGSSGDRTDSRLAVREAVTAARVSLLKRTV